MKLKPGFYLFNVGINKGYSINEIANFISQSFNYETVYEYDTTKPDGVDRKTVNGDYGKKLLKWSPEVSIEEGISITTNGILIIMDKNISEKIFHEEIHFATIIRPYLAQEGLSFLTDDEILFKLVYGIIKKHDIKLIITTHLIAMYETNETVYVVKGRITCNLYFEDGRKLHLILLKKVR